MHEGGSAILAWLHETQRRVSVRRKLICPPALYSRRNPSGYGRSTLHRNPHVAGSLDIDRAELSYREALGFAPAVNMPPLFAHWYLGLGKLHRRTGRGEQARHHLSIAAKVLSGESGDRDEGAVPLATSAGPPR